MFWEGLLAVTCNILIALVNIKSVLTAVSHLVLPWQRFLLFCQMRIVKLETTEWYLLPLQAGPHQTPLPVFCSLTSFIHSLSILWQTLFYATWIPRKVERVLA